jgi:hypothetical protein
VYSRAIGRDLERGDNAGRGALVRQMGRSLPQANRRRRSEARTAKAGTLCEGIA